MAGEEATASMAKEEEIKAKDEGGHQGPYQ